MGRLGIALCVLSSFVGGLTGSVLISDVSAATEQKPVELVASKITITDAGGRPRMTLSVAGTLPLIQMHSDDAVTKTSELTVSPREIAFRGWDAAGRNPLTTTYSIESARILQLSGDTRSAVFQPSIIQIENANKGNPITTSLTPEGVKVSDDKTVLELRSSHVRGMDASGKPIFRLPQ